MLITPERVLYAGLVGRPRERCQGAFNCYVALKGGLWVTTSDGAERYGELIVVPPNVRHTISSDHRSAIAVLIEQQVRETLNWPFASALSAVLLVFTFAVYALAQRFTQSEATR